MIKKFVVGLTLNVIAYIIGVVWCLPLIGLLMASVRPYNEIVSGWWNLQEFHITFDNFIKAWYSEPFPLGQGFINSFIVTIPSTLIPLMAGAFAAYGFSRFNFPLRDYFFMMLVVFYAMPLQAIALPVFRILNSLKLLNTFPGLILVHSAWGVSFATIFLRNYFQTLPREVEEAAKVDGASDFQIFFKIIFPMSLPGVISVLILQFSWVWSDFFFALLYIHSPEKYLATQSLVMMGGVYQISWNLLAAGSILVTLVPVIFYALLQKHFIRGMSGWVTGKG